MAIMIIAWHASSGQDSLPNRSLEVRGYVKDLQSVTFSGILPEPVTGNLIHNRINLKWTPHQRVTAALELRNRLFWGEEVRLTPQFASRLRNANEAANLSVNWVNEKSVVLHTAIDRWWIRYSAEQWNVRLGRQRINWGIGTTWNPNDLFNTYNFLDFDYEERPGSDAVRFQYSTGALNYVEAAFAVSNNRESAIGAVKYFLNFSGYDAQIIMGWFHQQPTVGLGWSGGIGENGFKGELQYFFQRANFEKQMNLTAEIDRVFEKGWYANLGICVNSRGIVKPPEQWSIMSQQFSPQNLMPTRWNSLVTISKEITPLLSASSTVIYGAGANLIIVMPTLSYSLTENTDVDLIWQSFSGSLHAGETDVSNRAFIRMRVSF